MESEKLEKENPVGGVNGDFHGQKAKGILIWSEGSFC